jgi:hypothetical protein
MFLDLEHLHRWRIASAKTDIALRGMEKFAADAVLS